MSTMEKTSECTKEELIQLRQLFLTQIQIESDWDWRKVKNDLKLISEVLGMKFEPTQEPSEGVIQSGLLSFQPNRSIQPLAHHLLRLMNGIQLSNGNPPRVYPSSVLVPAQFLLGHVLAELGPQRDLSQLLDCLHLRAAALLPQSLLKLVSEFSKVYRARLMINKICASQVACNKLAHWHHVTSTKSYNYFDNERERCEEAYKLFEVELSRRSTD